MTSWKAKAERGSAWLIHLIAWIARAAGRTVCRALLVPIVAYFVLTDGTARRASREFLARVTGRAARWSDAFSHLYCFAATLLDRVWMAHGDFHRFDVTVDGDPLVVQALESGKGCVLLGSHLGSFDLMTLKNKVLYDRPVTLLMHIDERARVRRIAGIDDSKLSVIPLGRVDSYLRAYEVLERGGIVVALADRAENAAALHAEFFGRPAPFPIGPHALAARAGAKVLMGFGLYEGGARYRIEFVDFGAAAPAGSRGAALQPAIDRYVSILEQYARRYPKNWFNFFPYWNQPAASAKAHRRRREALAMTCSASDASADDGVWIVIPAYNEARTIRGLAETALSLCVRVLVVDDGSSDGTAAQLDGLPLTVLRHPVNRGKAAGLRAAFAHALALGATCVVTIDGDGQHDPRDATKLLGVWRQCPDRLVIGARLHDRARIPHGRYVGNRIACFWISWAAGHAVADTQSGFRVYPRAVMEIALADCASCSGFTFESEIIIAAAQRGHRTLAATIGACYPADARPSHYRPGPDTIKIIAMVAMRLLSKGLSPRGLWRSLQREPEAMPSAQKALDSHR